MRTIMALALLTLGLIGSAAEAQAPPVPFVSSANKLTQEEIDALRRALTLNWPPSKYQGSVVVQLRLNPDGTLAAEPKVVSQPDDPQFDAAAQSAIKAIKQSQPFRMLKPSSYGFWKNMEISFDSTLTAAAERAGQTRRHETPPTPGRDFRWLPATQQPQVQFDPTRLQAVFAKATVKSNLGIQNWVTTTQLNATPDVYKNLVIGTLANFSRKISDGEAVFTSADTSIYVSHVPSIPFQENELVVLAGRVTGQSSLTAGNGNEVIAPTLDYKGVFRCTNNACSGF
jgi:hypothetical protein